MRSGRTAEDCLARPSGFPVPSLYYPDLAILSRIRIFANLTSILTCERKSTLSNFPLPL